jgi:hypothetical protein
MLAAMRHFALLLVLAGGLGGCAYQRYTTPLHPASDVKLASKDQPAQMYTFRLISADIPPTKLSGLAWDDDGSGPDPFARLYVDNQLVWESAVLENTAKPEWNVVLPRNVLIPSNRQFRIELWDKDTAVSADPIGSLEHTGLPNTLVPDALTRIELDNRAWVAVMISPPHPYRGVGLSVEARSGALKVYEVEPYSPAARAGIRVGELIVGIAGERVEHMGSNDAVSELALAADRGHKLMVADSEGKNEREVMLDHGYVWLIM